MDNVTVDSNDFDLFNAARLAAETFYNFDKTLDCNEIYSD